MANELLRFSSQKRCQLKIDVDVKKSKRRPFFQAFGKTIYEAEWISKTGPSIVLVKIHGARATREAAFYVQLSCHPHIVRTYGLVESDVDSVMLVQERAAEGDLAERLREKEFRPSQAVLLDIFLQITEAMICLADNEIVHGDLACRNVLLYRFDDREPERNLVKLTDFGLTRTSSLFSVVSSTVSTTLTIIPVRYAAPELIRDFDQPIYSEKSDVYSMGVLMWEALSRGQLPYGSIEDDEEVKRRILRGAVLDKPDHCDQGLWKIITRCWQQRADDRPTFKSLKEILLEFKFESRPPSNGMQSSAQSTEQRSTWRDIIPVDSYFDPAELGNKIRQIYLLSTCLPPKLILGREDEENIRQLCVKACEPAMLQFLKKADAMKYLLMFIRNYVTSLNTLAREIDKLELPDDQCRILKKMLDLRCFLLEADWFAEADTDVSHNRTARDNELLDKICDSHSNICSFQTLLYEQLKSGYLDRCTPTQYRILEGLWIGKDNLRLMMKKYNLPLITFDWLNQLNVVNIEMLTQSQVDHLIALDLNQARASYQQTTDFQTRQNVANLHYHFKANVRNLYQNEVLAQSVTSKETMRQLCDKINQALEEVKSINRTTTSDKAILRQQLNQIGARLQMNWHFSKEEMDMINELFDMIIRDLCLFLEIMRFSVTSEYPTDEDLIVCVSGGTALCGVNLIKPSRKILRPFLSCPAFISIEAPSVPSATKEFTFYNLADSSKFIRTIEASGISAALKMQFNVIESSSDVEANRATSTMLPVGEGSSKRTNVLMKMRCHIIPVRSFRIGKEQMKLSNEAETVLNLVTDSTTARTFFSDFGSHISDDTQHIGGIFIYQISAETSQEIPVETLKRAVMNEWDASHNLAYRTYGSHKSSSDQIELNRALYASGNGQSITIKHSLQSIGPACENLELFQTILSSNLKSCLLIDRGAASSFIPVWEIIDQLYPDKALMHEIAEILKRTWLTDASDCALSDSLLCEMDRVRLLQPTTIEYLQNSSVRPKKVTSAVPDLVSQLKEQLTEYIDTININYDTITDSELLNKVKNVIQRIIRTSHQNGYDLLSLVVCQSPVKDFLNSISRCENDQKFHETQAYMRTVFSERRLQHFEKRNVKLEPSFLKFIGRAISTAAKLDEQTLYLSQIDEYTNTPTVSLSELPQHLIQAVNNSSVAKYTASHITLLIKKRLVGATKNIQSDLDRRKLQAVRDVLMRFGWSMSSEEFSSPLNESGAVALQKELTEVLNDATLSSTDCSPLDPEETSTPKQIKRVDRSRKRTFAYKYCDWAIDRSLASTDQPDKQLIDILRHRLDIKLFSSATCCVQAAIGTRALTRKLLQKVTSQKSSSVDTSTVVGESNLVNSTIYDTLIQLVDDSDVLSQVELFRLLLERRSLVPLLTPGRLTRPFSYHVKPLTFTDVKLSMENYCNLSSDRMLFRVAVISMRNVKESESKEFLKQIFGCNSLMSSSVGGLGRLSKNNCVAEVGVGFCPKIDDDRGGDQSVSGYNEVLILHIIGDYVPIFPYIHGFADLFIVESHSDSSVQYRPSIPVEEYQKVIVWKSATVAHDPYVSEENYIHLQSTIAQALDQIHNLIDELVREADHRSRMCMQEMAYPTLYVVDTINWINVEEEVKKQDYFKLRTTELQLQQLFVQEVEHIRHKIQAQTTFAERETADHNIRQCQRRRCELAPSMYKHPLLKCFVGILSQCDEQVRTVGICQFIKHLEFHSKDALQELFRKQQTAHDEFNINSQNNEKRDAYYKAKRVYANSLVTIEHLWRELGHIYVSDTKRYVNLPVLAAKHLLDGFSLELLDGDAGMMEQTWITAIFHELNLLLTKNKNDNKDKKSTRILVLSVMGVQSSGKSTLLNLMFGTRLRASAGMCTRGVNIQLLKAEGRPEYDYVLILDTEGVRAPEFSGLQGATWRDNRLATFSILPADVTIIVINNEEDTAAREVLPIVMLAYQQSEIAAKSTNQLKTKLFFVYTRIDTNEKNKLSGIAQSLSIELRKAAADLEQTRRRSTNEPSNDDQTLASELLHDFRTDDIQFLGKLKVRDKPPEDIPEFDYGYDIVKLNTYIYDRLTKSSPPWRARDLSKFADYLNVIWQCVQTVDFTLSFRTVLERWAYEDLQVYCREMYGKLASLFSSEYDKHEPIILKTLDDPSLTTDDCERMIEKFETTFMASVQDTAENFRQEFISHINQQKHWQSWSVDTKRDWQIFTEKQRTDVTFRIRQLITSRLLFDQEFINYQKALRSNITASFEKKDQNERQNIVNDQSRQSREFEEIFNAILHSVNKQHPLINVENEVHNVYSLNNIGKDFDFTAHWRDFKTGQDGKMGGSESNIIRSLWKKVRETFSKSTTKKSAEEAKLLLELQTYINNLLIPIKQYIDHVPTVAIQTTQKQLSAYQVKRDELRKKAHQVTYTQLIIQLTRIQKEWEKNHSITVRLTQARPNMWEYYKKTVEGIHGIHLLKSELISVIERHLKNGFLTLLEQHVITNLIHETWIGNDQIVQAMLNLELITLIRKNEIERVIKLLSNMGEHYSTMVEDLFRQKIGELAQHCSDVYHDLIRQTIQGAVSETLHYRNPICDRTETNEQLIRRGRTEFFLHTLSRSLLGHRLSRFSDELNGLHVDSLSVCDSEENEVWSKVENEIMGSIPSGFRDDYLKPEDVDSLIKSIRDSLENRFARVGTTLRCSEPCPLCGSPCRAAAGHTTDPAEGKRRHDADHQPSGLFGTYQYETRELVPDSCSTNILRNFTFACSSAQDQRPYSEFSIHFPEWKQPPSLTTNVNEVGQYVFYHYQNELAKYHKCKPCREIPSSFDRSMDELKSKQERIINGIAFE